MMIRRKNRAKIKEKRNKATKKTADCINLINKEPITKKNAAVKIAVSVLLGTAGCSLLANPACRNREILPTAVQSNSETIDKFYSESENKENSGLPDDIDSRSAEESNSVLADEVDLESAEEASTESVDEINAESTGESLQASIASKILRFHVLANSDSDEDQALKLLVRDAVGAYLEPLLSESSDLTETKAIVTSNMQDIEATAEAVICEEGYDYSVSACLAWVDFPEKTYGDYTFPAGEYEALELVIGDGAGQNWWCVLYPNMCFRGSVYEVIDEDAEEELRQVLTPEEYEEVFSSGEVEVRFWLLDFLKELFS